MQLTEEQLKEIEIAKAEIHVTKRATVEALETILYEPISCLDKGHITLIDYMGNDGAIAQAARVSYGKGTKKVSDDRNLIRYLIRNEHTSPLEMCEIKLHCKMPIFVARQWMRHRTASISEVSLRYSEAVEEFYIPDVTQITAQSKDNKQGRDTSNLELTEEHSTIRSLISDYSESSYENYLMLLHGTEEGHLKVARELARIVLPVNLYTSFYWKIDLHNLLHFLKLRLHSHAQYEIRVFAEAIASLVEKWCPVTWHAFQDYKVNAITLSVIEKDVVAETLAKEVYTDSLVKTQQLSTRELQEAHDKLYGITRVPVSMDKQPKNEGK